MKTAIVRIPGDPFGKQRPRFTRSGHTYTPAPTRDYESRVQLEYLRQVGTVRFSGPLKIDIMAYYRIPASDTRAIHERKLTGQIRPTKKPDIDNVAKVVMDGLNGVAYRDDKDVAELHVRKIYSDDPRVEVTLQEVEDES